VGVLKFALATVFLGGQAAQPLLDRVSIDRLFHALQFMPQSSNVSKMALPQSRLKPGVEIFDAAVRPTDQPSAT
jgi:hypothetical protein